MCLFYRSNSDKEAYDLVVLTNWLFSLDWLCKQSSVGQPLCLLSMVFRVYKKLFTSTFYFTVVYQCVAKNVGLIKVRTYILCSIFKICAWLWIKCNYVSSGRLKHRGLLPLWLKSLICIVHVFRHTLLKYIHNGWNHIV